MSDTHINNVAFSHASIRQYNLATLSKDHTRNTEKKGKKDTIFKGREPQNPYPIPRHLSI